MGKRRKNRKAGQTISNGDGDWRRKGTVWTSEGKEGYSSNEVDPYSNIGNRYQTTFKWRPSPTCAFILKGTEGLTTSIWGGSADEMLYTPVKLLVCLEHVLNAYRPQPRVVFSEGAKKLLPEDAQKTLVLPSSAWISLHWPDYGVPRLNEVWWRTFVDHIANIGGAVGFCCSGGIGRTGTALSIVAGLGGLLEPGDDPVRFVREHYYEDAVESDEQMRYIERITGIAIHEPLYGRYDYAGKYQSAINTGTDGTKVSMGFVPNTTTNTTGRDEPTAVPATVNGREVEKILGPNGEFRGYRLKEPEPLKPEDRPNMIKSAIESAKTFFKDGAMP